MNYGPKPLVEEHYHITDLIDAQQKRADDREYHRNVAKEREERNSLIRDSKPICITDFWCNKCKEDFKSMSIKEVEVDWSCPSQNIAFYRSKCDKGHWVIRLITDRHRDGFWVQSRKVAIDQGTHFADTIQPYQTGFNLLYNKI